MKNTLVLLVLAALVAGPAVAQAAREEGAARHTPWSGYWWPLRKGELIYPLAKYDQLTGAHAAAWERQHKPPGAGQESWAGYCHAWSASAVMEEEPRAAKYVQGVSLSVADQKGLLAASHSRDVANTYGDRYGDGRGGEDYQDIYPDVLWHYLKLYVKQQGVPLVADLEAGRQVWNYPVYAYRVDYAPAGGMYQGQMSLWAADDSVPPDYVGTKVHYKTYTFTFQMRNGNVVSGSARWTGASVKDHPDFVWYPYVVVPENTEVSYARVKNLLGVASAGGSAPPGAVPGTPPGTVPGTYPGTHPGTTTITTTTPGHGPGYRPNQPGYHPGHYPGYQPGRVNPIPMLPPPIVRPNSLPGIPPMVGGSDGSSNQVDQSAYRQVPISPVQLVGLIENRTSTFNFDITVDKFDGGRYVVGEPFRVTGVSDQDGFLYLLYLDSQGNLSLLCPPVENLITVKARQRFEMGPYTTSGIPGTHRIKGLVTKQPLMLTGLMGGGEAGLQGQGKQQFQFPPAQQEQFQQMLQQYQQSQQSQSTGKPQGQVQIDPAGLVGPFGQDEVAIYVGPVGGKADP